MSKCKKNDKIIEKTILKLGLPINNKRNSIVESIDGDNIIKNYSKLNSYKVIDNIFKIDILNNRDEILERMLDVKINDNIYRDLYSGYNLFVFNKDDNSLFDLINILVDDKGLNIRRYTQVITVNDNN